MLLHVYIFDYGVEKLKHVKTNEMMFLRFGDLVKQLSRKWK